MNSKKASLATALISTFCVADAFGKGAWSPIASMPTARWGLAATTANCPPPNDDRMCIYALGGDTRIDVPNVVDTVEAYDPEADTWSTRAPMPTSRRFLAAVALDGKIYALGGGPPFRNTVERYDPSTNTWTAVRPMSTARTNLGAATAKCPPPNGDRMCIYALGGYNGVTLASAEAYDPNTDAWGPVASLLSPRAEAPVAATGLDGKIYLIGGVNGVDTLDTVEAYDPKTDTWCTRSPMPTARRFLAGGTGKDGTIYAIGGVCCGVDFPGTDPHFFDRADAYTPAADTWSDLPPMSTVRGGLRAAVGEDGRIFAVGGYDGKNILNTAEAYSPAGAGGSRFGVTDLGTLGGERSVACGLNDRGQIVGFSSLANGESHAFIWDERGMTDLGTLPDLGFSEARNINSRGQVVGDSTAQFFTPPFHAALWEKSGKIRALGTLGGAASFAVDINSRGQLVGGARDGSGQLHAFLWQDGEMRDLGTLPGHVLSVARGINHRGQAVGNSEPVETASIGHCPTTPVPVEEHHGVLWDNGVVTDLGTLGGVFGLAKGINERGQVVGSSSIANSEEHAFLWSEGAMTDLGTLGGGYSLANRINHRGRVVGLSRTSDGELHAVLWQSGLITDLNSLIPADSGWVLVEATDINRAGKIVGVGIIHGETHAFLLTPIEEHE